MKAVHFGAGNIGRGFIGEVLFHNDFEIDFVDLNETIINALKERNEYEIELAADEKEQIKVSGVSGLNNGQEPEAVIEAIAEADIVTTAIGPNVLPHIAELIGQGLAKRLEIGNKTPIDLIACENMIGGSEYLREQVMPHLDDETTQFVERFVGFPNAAVDRIVPLQDNEDPLFVSVEPFSEWIIDQTDMKADHIKLDGVIYVEDLEPYIERKLFSVNTGHATVAYTGFYKGYETIKAAIDHKEILDQLEQVLGETGTLLENKWDFDHATHKTYTDKIISRFQNGNISDLVTRVARNPIQKLGYNERFIRPIRESKERGLTYDYLLSTVAMMFHYDNPEDKQSQTLQTLLKEKSLEVVIKEVAELEDQDLVSEIKEAVESI